MNLMEIKHALLFGDNANPGAAALFSEGRDPLKWQEIRENPFYMANVQWAVSAGERFTNEPIKALRFSDYRLFDTNGSRKEYEKEYFERRTRLHVFAVLSILFDDARYIAQLEDILWAICDESTWCLPAHLEGKSLSPEEIDTHSRVVDLFNAETGFALSEICALLSHKLAPVIVRRAENLVRERVLAPFCAHTFFWETVENNWAAVCGGSVGAAALYLIEESNQLAPVVLKVLNAMTSFLNGFADDGACTEGVGYWNYGFGFFVYFAALLKERTAGKIDLLAEEKIRKIALFQQKVYLSGNKVVSFSDGRLQLNFNPGLTNFLKKRFSEVEIPDMRFCSKTCSEFANRWGHFSRYFAWSSPNMQESFQADSTYYFKDAQWLICKTAAPVGNVAFAAKGGHNEEPHNHNDVGSFILHVNGESLLTDTGMGEYTKQYFSPERYTIFCNGSQGHSVPIINGRYQSTGKEHAATILKKEACEEKVAFELDIVGAYTDTSLKSLVRSFEFVKSQPLRLILKDTYQFSEKPISVIERFISFREPVLLEPGKVKLESHAGSIMVVFDPELFRFSVEKNVFINHTAQAEDVYCIDLAVINPSTAFTTCITFEM